MRIEQELKDFKARFDPRIDAYFDTVIDTAGKEDDLIAEAIGHVRELVMAGGKRLRAAFMYYGYLGAGGKEEDKILQAAVSVELLHAFLLVHDDIIDRDDLRHGVATLHRRYADFGKRYFPDKDTEHFGNAIAIIMGDMLCAFGNDIIFRSTFPPELVLQALSRIQRIVSFTVIGQARDIYMEYRREATEEEILRMYENKTAKYTVEGPLHLGAILAGAPQSLLDGLSGYSIPLGIAFQIQDDILGVFGSEERLGKPVGSDIEEGKITLLVSRTLKNGTVREGERLRALLAKGKTLTERDIEEFRELIRNTGAYDEAKTLAADSIRRGRQALAGIRGALDPKAYDFLDSVAEYMLERDY